MTATQECEEEEAYGRLNKLKIVSSPEVLQVELADSLCSFGEQVTLAQLHRHQQDKTNANKFIPLKPIFTSLFLHLCFIWWFSCGAF